MTDFRRRELLKLAGAAGTASVASSGALARSPPGRDVPAGQPDRGPPREYDDYAVHRVPDDYDTIQMAVNAADSHDLVLVGPGVYHEEVKVTGTPQLTIRGTDRNEVILDGTFTRYNAVVATVDGVVVENMTARRYRYNGFYWTGVDGYRGSYLTAYNNGEYGIYAFDSVDGRFEHSYASGHPDSGIYIGQCNPCRAVVADCVAEHNAVGYSGTNASGYTTLRDSVWRSNMSGIVPNTLDSEELAPQVGIRIEGNEVEGNHNVDAPALPVGFPAFGNGVVIAGGSYNEVVENRVRDHANFGVLVTPNVDGRFWLAAGNEVRGNDVAGSGRADLAVGMPTGGGNCFSDNDFETSRPAAIESRHGCADRLAAIGDLWPTLVLGKAALMAELGETPGGDWREGPVPDDQPAMADPERPPREPVRGWADGR